MKEKQPDRGERGQHQLGAEMTDLAHAQAAISSPSVYVGPRDLSASVVALKLIIVVDPREFSRSCLTSWLDNLGSEFEVTGLADVRRLLRPDQLMRASAVILSVGAGAMEEAWVEHQVRWLRQQRSDVPVVAILESSAAVRGNELVARLALQGHIPTSSSPEIAKAALRLIFVGGSYSPPMPQEPRPPNGAGTDHASEAAPLAPKLTPREARVLELLMQGMANKIIAYRLGMSQSTVKVHVHSIIRKFNVRNRTEVAVAARELRNLG